MDRGQRRLRRLGDDININIKKQRRDDSTQQICRTDVPPDHKATASRFDCGFQIISITAHRKTNPQWKIKDDFDTAPSEKARCDSGTEPSAAFMQILGGPGDSAPHTSRDTASTNYSLYMGFQKTGSLKKIHLLRLASIAVEPDLWVFGNARTASSERRQPGPGDREG